MANAHFAKKYPFTYHGLLTAVVALVGLLGCSTFNKNGSLASGEPTGTVSTASTEHEALIENFSDGDTQYSGFYNNFEYKATLLNSSVRAALLARQSDYYQWDRDKRLSEKERSETEMASETMIFVSFFTPDRRNDNLSDSKSIWRIYLEVGGQRYPGKAKKLRSLLAELQALYPYHTRWNTAYLVSFAIPTGAMETQSSSLTITGPLGTRTVNFKQQP